MINIKFDDGYYIFNPSEVQSLKFIRKEDKYSLEILFKGKNEPVKVSDNLDTKCAEDIVNAMR